jgi:acyl-CoA synthetase (AMP-forming)/AMP-acid ligase II
MKLAQEQSSVVSQVRERARCTPNRVAVHFGNQSLTFADIERRSNQVAEGLRAAGVRRASRIGILAKNTPTFYDLALGAAKVGVALVPVNYRLAPAEMAYILRDAEVGVMFVASDYVEMIGQIQGELPDLRQVISIDGPEYPCREYTDWRERHDDVEAKYNLDPEDVFVQAYSSGTTGRPKGVPLTNRNIWEALKVRLEAWGPWHDRDVIHIGMPQYHMGAIMWGLGGLCRGVGSVLTREYKPAELLDLIQRYRITKTQLASSMLKMLLDEPGCANTDFSSLEYICYGGGTSSEGLAAEAQRAFRCGLCQGYGMTESSGAMAYMTPPEYAEAVGERLKSAGRALPSVEIRICGPDGSVLGPRELGEIVCRGPQVMKGYWKLPEASAETLRDGWLHTGDAGYMDEDGYVYVCDRIKDMIRSGGENIYSAEVESALSAHPSVKDAAVIAVPDAHWGEVAKAFVVVEPKGAPTEHELIEFVRGRIAHYKAPKSVEFVKSLPRNASGKVLKRELRAPYWKAHR